MSHETCAQHFFAAAALAAPLTIHDALAQDSVADFYKRTNITILVGSGVGGGYDAYARLLARHMGRFVPGSPTMIVQNMPGAGGLKSANHLYMVAPKDGATLAILHNTLTLNQIAKSASVSIRHAPLCMARQHEHHVDDLRLHRQGAKSRSRGDIFDKDVIGTSSGSTSMIPAILNSLVGTQIQAGEGLRIRRTTFCSPWSAAKWMACADGDGTAPRCRRCRRWSARRSSSASTSPTSPIRT